MSLEFVIQLCILGMLACYMYRINKGLSDKIDNMADQEVKDLLKDHPERKNLKSVRPAAFYVDKHD